MIFDSHCHPQFPQYKNDREEMIQRALEGGVFMICVGTDLKTSKEGIELAQKHEGIWAAIGLHPNDNLDEEFRSEEYDKLLKEERVVAMGEIGLDYYRTTEESARKFQKERFEKQLDIVAKNDVPVILHSRDAGKGSVGIVHNDMLAILKNNLPARRGVAHSFTGTVDEAKKYLDLGFSLGFNGIITFARQYDEVVKYLPLERILLETDAPYLTPEPYRGQRNEPLYVKKIANKVADIKGIDVEKVIKITSQNTKNLFALNI